MPLNATFRLFGFVLFSLLIMSGCSDEGGKLTEFGVRLNAEDNNDPLKNITIQLAQSGSFTLDNTAVSKSNNTTFKTDKHGRVGGHFFTNGGTNSSIRIGALNSSELNCYPRELLTEGEVNMFEMSLKRPALNLQIDLTNYRNRVDPDQIILNMIHYPDNSNREHCAAVVFHDTLGRSDPSVLDISIYPFGMYSIEGHTSNYTEMIYEVFSPNENDTLINVVLQ